MNTITIRNLDDHTKQSLRERAARRGVSMEEEVRSVLRESAASRETNPRTTSLYDDIRQLIEPHGGFDIPVPARQRAARPIPFEDWDEDVDYS